MFKLNNNFIIDLTDTRYKFVLEALDNKLANKIYLDEDYRINYFMSYCNKVFGLTNLEQLQEEFK